MSAVVVYSGMERAWFVWPGNGRTTRRYTTEAAAHAARDAINEGREPTPQHVPRVKSDPADFLPSRSSKPSAPAERRTTPIAAPWAAGRSPTIGTGPHPKPAAVHAAPQSLPKSPAAPPAPMPPARPKEIPMSFREISPVVVKKQRGPAAFAAIVKMRGSTKLLLTLNAEVLGDFDSGDRAQLLLGTGDDRGKLRILETDAIPSFVVTITEKRKTWTLYLDLEEFRSRGAVAREQCKIQNIKGGLEILLPAALLAGRG